MKALRLLLIYLLLSAASFGQFVVVPTLVAGQFQANAPIDNNGWHNFKVTLTQNVIFSFAVNPPVPPPAQSIVQVIFTQDGVGSRTVTFASNISNPCSITGTPNATTVCGFMFDGTTNLWLGIAAGAGGSNAVVFGTPTSFANECQSLANGAGGTTTATPIIQTVDGSGVAHDAMCRTTAANIIFPLPSGGYNAGQGISSANRTFEFNRSLASGRNGISLTNLTNTGNRGNAIQFRSCTPGCGTDFLLFTDSNTSGSEDVTLQGGTGQNLLYITGNCPLGCPIGYGPLNGSNGVTQFLMGDDRYQATTNPEFGLVTGHISHGISPTSSSHLDNWNTVTLSGGTGTVTFNLAWSAAPLCVCNNPNQSGAVIPCSASASTTTLTIKSGAGTDTVNYLCLGNPY